MKIVGPFRVALPALLIIGGLLEAARPAWAIIDYGSGSGTRNTSSPVAAVANYEGNWGSFLGTPIGSYYFVSAKHINGGFGDGVGQTFTLNSQNYTVTGQFDSPSTDLTVWEVNPTASGTAFTSGQIVPLYTNTNEFNKSLVVTGRGTTVGAPVMVGASLKGWKWGTLDGQQSWGTNVVSQANYNGGAGVGTLLRFAFDSSGGSTEGSLSEGDSGGAVFIQDPSDSVWKLAGINYGTDGPYSLSSDGSNSFNASIFDRNGLYQNLPPWTAEAGAGSSYATRISSNATWINSITGSSIWTGGAGNGNWINSANWTTAPSNGSNLVFSGTTQTATNNNSLSSAGTITFDGSAGSFSLSGGALTISGMTNFSASTQTVNLNLTLSASQQFNAIDGNITVNGTVANGGNTLTMYTAPNLTSTLAGSVSGTGGLTKSGTGNLILSASNNYGGGTTVSAGALTIQHYQALGSGGLTVNGSAIAQIGDGVGTVVIPSLSVNSGSATPTARLDVGANAVVIPYSGASPYSTIKAQVLYASDGLANDRPGITTSGADGFTTALGYAEASELFIANGGTFVNNQSPRQSPANTVITNQAVILKYTWIGDTDLDGDVELNDLNNLLAFYGTPVGGGADWALGDFDGNGSVDVNDVNHLLSLYGTSGLGVAGASAPVPVPEPSTLLLAAMGLAGLGIQIARHRRRC